MVELLRAFDDLHAAPAQHVRRPQEHRVADPFRHPQRLVAAAGNAVGRLLEPELLDERSEPLAVLGEIDAVGRSAKDRHARRLQLRSELERRLPAKLDDHSEKLALLLLALDDLEY